MDPFTNRELVPDIDEQIIRRLRIPGGRGKRRPKYPNLPPDEEKSVLGEVLNKGVGGLQYLGETLDKPGRMIRGLATGNLRELGNAIPFSDTLGITDPAKQTSGKDLLQHFGLQEKGAQGFLPGAAGFAAEVLTDPTTYMTFGASAVGKAGKVAKAAGISLKGANRFKTLGEHLPSLAPEALEAAKTAAGKLGTTLDALKGEQLGGAFGLTTGPFGLLGLHATHVPEMAKGPAAQAAIEGLGKIGETVGKLPGIKQGIATMRGAFGHQYQGHFDPIAQQAAKAGYEASQKGKGANLLTHLNQNDELAKLIDDFHVQYGQQVSPAASAADALKRSGEVVRNAVQHYGETQGKVGAFEHIVPGLKVAPDIEKRGQGIAAALKQAQDDLAAKYIEQGGNLNVLQSTEDFGHFARRGAKHEGLSGLRSRREATRYVPAASQEKMLQDPSLIFADTGKVRARVPPMILAKRLLDSPTYRQIVEEAATASGKDVERAARDIADRLHSKGLVNLNKPLYSSDVIGNSKKFTESMGLKVANNDALHGLLNANLVPAGEGTVALKDVFADAGMMPGRAAKYMGKLFGKDPKALWQMHVPQDVANAAVSLTRKTTDPEWLGAFGKLTDQFNKWFKTNVTLPFPGFAVRNFFSGQGMNFMSNEIPDVQHAAKYFQELGNAKRLLDNPTTAHQMLNELSAYGVFDAKDVRALDTELGWGFHTAPNPVTGRGVIENLKTGRAMARENGFNLGEGLLASTKIAQNPIVKKTIGYAATPAHVGAEFNKQIEFLNRVAPYLYFRKHLGWTPEAAASKVRQLQVAYEELAPFEKQVMRRLVPFYCVPDDTTCLTRDGWKTCDELQVGDEILTYNKDTDRMEWQPCLERAIFDFDGELSTMANSRHKIRCTDNHRWMVRKPRLDDSLQDAVFVETKDFTSTGVIVVAAPLTAAEDSILTPEQAELLGWLVTDGYWRTRKHSPNHVEAMIYQHPGKFLEDVKWVAGGKPRKPHPDSGVVCVPVLQERIKPIKKYLNKKNLVSVVTRLSRPAAQAMYNAMYLGDGTVKTRTSDFLACQNDGVREAFRVLCVLLGRRSTVNYGNGIPRGAVTSRKRHLSCKDLSHGTERYTGRVWCPRTENGTWVMQQGNLITVTGNTYTRKIMPAMASQLAERPGGVTGQIVRASNTGRSENEFVPPYVGEGMSVKLGPDKYLSQLGLPTDQFSDLFVKGPSLLGTIKRTGQKALAMTNPLVKGPLETATGTNFFTGRPIEESFRYPTGNVLLNQVLHNTPASRAITSVRQMGDERKDLLTKGLNFGTGLKITDVSGGLDRMEKIAESKMLAEMLRESPNINSFTDVYVRKDKTGKPVDLTPEEDRLYRAYIGIQREKNKEIRKRKKAPNRPAAALPTE